jgi:N-methylhydantoinase A
MSDDGAQIGLAKVSSTPPRFEQGVLGVIRKSHLQPASATAFVHGSTVIINALTERTGARTGLVTTKGFRDVLAIGRANRPDIYNFRFRKQPPFVPREYRYEVEERLNYKGEILVPLNYADVERVAAQIRADGLETVAICFLHSYANPAHEQACAARLAELLPGTLISQSNEITREWREYERTSTVVLNAYVRPVARQYLTSLERELHDGGITAPLYIMKSGGGTASFAVSENQPIHMVESGPVGGVVGALAIGRACGIDNLITLDIGGTTAKVSLIDHGLVKVTTDYRIERDAFTAGYPIKVPVVDIVEIGAGGGSIAWIDAGHALQVGPRSAGAVPGPACYGQGSTSPTVTDANLVAGRINPDYFLGGEIAVSVERAREAIQPLAASFGISADEAATGIIRVTNANMENALRLVSVQRGYDPRDYTLVAFGGGGSMHAAELARELQIKRVLVPRAPAHFSAWGMLTTDPRQDFVQTEIIRSSNEAWPGVLEIFRRLEDAAMQFFTGPHSSKGEVVVARFADMRYLGQEHTVRVPVPAGMPDRADVEARFHTMHEQTYTFRLTSQVELVNFHVSGSVPLARVDFQAFLPSSNGRTLTPKGSRRVNFDAQGWHDATCFERDSLAVGVPVAGPAIIEEPAATTVIYPGQTAEIDRIGNILIDTGV